MVREESTAKFTPGPWEAVYEDDPERWPGVDVPTCSIILYGVIDSDVDDGGIRGTTREEAGANARLIAASPDLYAALKALCLPDGQDRRLQQYQAAAAVLLKVEGGGP